MSKVGYLKNLKRNIPISYISCFLGNLIFIIPIWVAFERQFITFTQMSLISATRLGLTALLELPTGAIADLIGRKYSVMLGYFIEAIRLIILAFATNGWSILFAAIFGGIGDALRSGADTAIVYDTLKELDEVDNFGRVRTILSFLTQIGIILSSVLAGYMFEVWKGLPYFIYAICLIIAGFLQLLMQEPSIDSEKFTFTNYIKQTKDGIRETIKSNYNKLLSLYYLLVGGITWSTQIYLNQIYASSIGYDEIAKGWLFAIIRFVNVIIIIKILKVDRLLKRNVAFLIFPVLIIFSTIFSIFDSIKIGTVILFTITLASTLRFIVLDKFTNDVFESKFRATAISALNLYVSVVYVIIVLISGYVIDNYSVGVYYFCLGIISILFMLPLGIKLSKQTK